MEKWYNVKGKENDVVLFTRIRLARNLEDYPFPVRLSTEEMSVVTSNIRDVVLTAGQTGLSFIETESLSRSQAVSLAERYLISPEFASDTSGRGLFLSRDEGISIMVCEKDHLRIQVISSGLEFDRTYERLDSIDSIIDKGLGYAFDEKLGYLTQSPSDLGTGMRASVVLHLPGLSITGGMNRLSQTVSRLGLSLRSFSSDGVNPVGNIYRLSNRVTLGISEQAALGNLKSIAMQIISQERQARRDVVQDDRYIDKIHRAYGIISSAYLMSCREFTELASLVRLGASCGITDVQLCDIDELLINMQPATVRALYGEEYTGTAGDKLRAEKIKEKLCR